MIGKVENRFNSGRVKATVWKNTSRYGEEFHSVSLNKSYMKDGEWKNSNSFNTDDIDKAIDVLQQAKEYLSNENIPQETVV